MKLVGATLAIAAAIVAVIVFVRLSGHREAVSDQGYSGTAIVSADGRVLTVGPYSGRCGFTVTAVARESRARVALFLQDATGPTCALGEGTMAMVLAQRIQLRAPLGRRELVDGATGAATPWLSARLVLRPRFIPAGYRSSVLLPWMPSALYPRGMKSAACTQRYWARKGPGVIAIIQSSDGLQLQQGGSWAPIRVRGLPAQAAAGVITWREQGLTDAIVAGPGLTTSQLVAIADSASSLDA